MSEYQEEYNETPETQTQFPVIQAPIAFRRSKTIAKLAAALSKAQGEYGVAMKDTSNPFFKSKYADLSSIINATRKALSDNGIAVVQPVQSDTDKKLVIITTLLACGEEWMETDLHVPTAKWDAQTLGSASTYGRRYALQGILTVAGEDDDGNQATEASAAQARDDHHSALTPKMESQQRIATFQVKAFWDAAKKAGKTEGQVSAYLADLGKVQVEELIKLEFNDALKWASAPIAVPEDMTDGLTKSVAQVKERVAIPTLDFSKPAGKSK